MDIVYLLCYVKYHNFDLTLLNVSMAVKKFERIDLISLYFLRVNNVHNTFVLPTTSTV